MISIGKLLYYNHNYKLIVEVDSEIANYYRSTIPKYFKVNKPLYAPHISVVRNEIPINMQYWRKYDYKEVSFEYENYVYNDDTYYWLNCYSKDLEDIRIELGLTATSEITRSPDGKHKFHCTIANTKKI